MKKISRLIILFMMILCFSVPVYAEKGSNDITTYVNNAKTGFNISWKKVPGTKYYVLFKKTGNGKLLKYKTFGPNTFLFQDKNVKNDQKYFYTVRAFKTNKIEVPKDGRVITRIRIPSITYFSTMKNKGVLDISQLTYDQNVYHPDSDKYKYNIRIEISEKNDFVHSKVYRKDINLKGKRCFTIKLSSLGMKGNYSNKVLYIRIRNIIGSGNYKSGWGTTRRIEKDGYGIVAHKPIIYLYPEEETDINVSVKKPELLTVSYPEYKEEGWNVTASSDGTLTMGDKTLYSLYYEADTETKADMSEPGFIVAKEDTADFLEEKLDILGLSYKEKEEFIIYWLPELQKNPYNYIRFMTTEEVDKIMPVDITPAPDTMIRVWMKYEGLEEMPEEEIEEQILNKQERTGFTAVEWGGVS